MAIGFTDLDKLFKTRYADKKKVLDLTLKDHPTLAMLPRNEKMSGRSFYLPVIGGNPQGHGAKFAAAQGNKNAGGDQGGFDIKRGRLYTIFSIDTETILASEGQDASFIEARVREMDGAIQGHSDYLSRLLFRDGTGELGRLDAAAVVGTDTFIKLAQPSDALNFGVGSKVSLVNPGTGLYRNPGGNGGATAFVVAIDEDAGTLSVSATLGGAPAVLNTLIAAAVAGDIVVRDGDYNATPTVGNAGTLLLPTGFAGWIPTTAPGGADNFFTQNRSTNARVYAGVRYNGNGGPLKKLATKMASKLGNVGGRPDLLVMDFSNFELLETEVEAKRVYIESQHPGIGFEGFKIAGPKGPITVLADNSCQPDRFYMLQTDTWEFGSIGEAPRILNLNGNTSHVEASADAWEWRLATYGQFYTRGPGLNAVGLI